MKEENRPRNACVQPGAVSAEDLVAFADGEASPAVRAHLQVCTHCAEEAERYRMMQETLSRRLHRVDCPSPQTLGEYDLGLTSAEERQSIAGHVLDCPRCAEELATLRAFLATEDVAPERERGPLVALRRLLAVQVMPSPDLAYQGLRGTAEAPTRTYAAEGVSIALSITPEPRRGYYTLVGLLLPDDPVLMAAGDEVSLVGDGDVRYTTVDELGNFAFGGVAEGSYVLEIKLGDRIVAIEGLQIGE